MGTSRLFVTKEDVFTLAVLFTKEGELKVARESNVKEEDKDKWERFEVEFSMPDFGTSKAIMRNSTEFDRGSTMLNASAFTNSLLTALARKWNLKDDKGQEIPLDLQKLNELRPDIARMFIELLQEKLTKEGVYEAILLS